MLDVRFEGRVVVDVGAGAGSDAEGIYSDLEFFLFAGIEAGLLGVLRLLNTRVEEGIGLMNSFFGI